MRGAATDAETAAVEAGVGGEQVQKRGWRAEGEQVYAVQYCKVKFRTFSSKGVLGQNRWRVYVGRGNSDEEDSVEAVLDDREGDHEGGGEGEGEEEGEVRLGDDEEFWGVVN